MKLFVKATLLVALFFHLLLLSSLTTRLDEVTSRWIAATSRMSEADARSVAPWERRVNGPVAEEDITLCVKTFARPGCLSRLLRTVRARYPLMPIIVADDSAEPAAIPFGGVELIELSARTGCAFGRNMLVQRVRTPYLIFMDDDMYPDDSLDLLKWVERVRELKVDLVAATVEDATYGRLAVQEFVRMEDELHVLHNNVSSLSPWLGSCIEVNYALQVFAAPTAVLREVSWDPVLKTAEHDDFMLSLNNAGKRLATCTDFLVIHSRDDLCVSTEEHQKGRRDVMPFMLHTMRKWGLSLITYLGERYTLVGTPPANLSVQLTVEALRDVASPADRTKLAARALALYNAPRLGWFQRVLDGDDAVVSVQERAYNLLGGEAVVRVRTRWHRPKSERDASGSGAKLLTISMRHVYADAALYYSFCHFVALVPPAPAPVVYVVTAVYNVKDAFLRSLDQLRSAAATVRVHWVVVDFRSTDVNVADELADAAPLEHTLVTLRPPFCRSAALNAGVAAIAEPDPLVFVIDAAMEYTEELLVKAPLYVRAGRSAWAPLYYGADVSYWIHYGFGSLAFYRSDFVRIGKFDEARWGCKYGAEDMDLAGRLLASGLLVWRTEERLVHLAHPRQAGYLDDRNLWDAASPAPPLLVATQRLKPLLHATELLSMRAGTNLRSADFYITARANRTDVLHALTGDNSLALFECQAKDVMQAVVEADA